MSTEHVTGGFNLFCAHLHVPPFLDPKLFIGYSPLDLGNSDVWGMQCFCSVAF